MITCSSHGKAALSFADKAKDLARNDEENLVRVRAAEFLALVDAPDSRELATEVITQSLKNARHGVEANLILNTVVLLRDGPQNYQFDVPEDFKTSKPGVAEVDRRLLYLHDKLPW